jgi:hypothetical protein
MIFFLKLKKGTLKMPPASQEPSLDVISEQLKKTVAQLHQIRRQIEILNATMCHLVAALGP